MRRLHRIAATAIAVAIAASATACGDDGGGPDAARPDAAGPDAGAECATPSEGVYATFDVVGQTYRQSITNPNGIDQAIALWRGTSAASIPNGVLQCAPASWNCGFTWHVSPGSVEFAELTTEVCDGTPSYVEENCAAFGMFYCPWSATLIDLRDCRSDPGCPQVPR